LIWQKLFATHTLTPTNRTKLPRPHFWKMCLYIYIICHALKPRKGRHAYRYHKGINAPPTVVHTVTVTYYLKCNYTLHARAAGNRLLVRTLLRVLANRSWAGAGNSQQFPNLRAGLRCYSTRAESLPGWGPG